MTVYLVIYFRKTDKNWHFVATLPSMFSLWNKNLFSREGGTPQRDTNFILLRFIKKDYSCVFFKNTIDYSQGARFLVEPTEANIWIVFWHESKMTFLPQLFQPIMKFYGTFGKKLTLEHNFLTVDSAYNCSFFDFFLCVSERRTNYFKDNFTTEFSPFPFNASPTIALRRSWTDTNLWSKVGCPRWKPIIQKLLIEAT